MTANQIAYWNYVENSRHNRATERETGRSNKAREIETYRSNTTNEGLSAERNELLRAQNSINAQYNLQRLEEDSRHNRAQESLEALKRNIEQQQVDVSYAKLANDLKAAQIRAGAQYAAVGATYASIAEQNRANIARETENTRHAMETERTANREVSVSRINAAANTSRAQTAARGQTLSEAQWYDPNEVNRRKAQTALNVTQTFETATRGVTNVINSISNAVGAATRAISVGGMLQ